MAVTNSLAADARMEKNAYALKDILRRKHAGTEELVKVKNKMQDIFEVLPELGKRWAQAYLELAENLGLHPETVSVYVVGGMIYPYEPLRVREFPRRKIYSDLDLVFAVENSEQSLESMKALSTVIIRSRNFNSEECRGLIMGRRLMRGIRRDGGEPEPEDVNQENFDAAHVYLNMKLIEKVKEVVEAHGIKDAQEYVDVPSIDARSIDEMEVQVESLLIGTAKSKADNKVFSELKH